MAVDFGTAGDRNIEDAHPFARASTKALRITSRDPPVKQHERTIQRPHCRATPRFAAPFEQPLGFAPHRFAVKKVLLHQRFDRRRHRWPYALAWLRIGIKKGG